VEAVPRILRINPEDPDPEILEEALSVLRKGGLVIYPTDTVYGLGADPMNPEAVDKVHEAKRRTGKPLPLLLDEPGRAERYAEVGKKALRLMREFWPGQLTIILRLRAELPPGITMGTGKIALRVPDCAVARLLAEGLGGAIIGTSANISGAPSPRTAEEAIAQLGEKVDLVLDGGITRHRLSSTIIDLTVDPPRIIRVGPIPPEEIEAVIGPIQT
jgi:L-threonylcarbamoyladenylate synthase